MRLIIIVAVVLVAVLGCSAMATTIAPIAMSNRSLGGTALNDYTPGVVGALGPNNIGLLVKTWGKVTWVDTANQCFYIDDGSRIPAGTTRSDNGQTVYGVRVGYSGLATGVAPVTPPAENDYVLVTGICSTIRYTVGDDIRPNVRVRSGADISNLN